LIEFAILLPVLAFFLIGMIDVGRATYYGILASNAARAGAAYGSQYLWTATDSGGINGAVAQDAPNVSWTVNAQSLCSVNGSSLTTCATSNTPSNTVYYVKVNVTGSFTPLISYPGIPNPIPISGQALTRVTTQ
jgi:Flp pilus assembly protein TadG